MVQLVLVVSFTVMCHSTSIDRKMLVFLICVRSSFQQTVAAQNFIIIIIIIFIIEATHKCMVFFWLCSYIVSKKQEITLSMSPFVNAEIETYLKFIIMNEMLLFISQFFCALFLIIALFLESGQPILISERLCFP